MKRLLLAMTLALAALAQRPEIDAPRDRLAFVLKPQLTKSIVWSAAQHRLLTCFRSDQARDYLPVPGLPVPPFIVSIINPNNGVKESFFQVGDDEIAAMAISDNGELLYLGAAQKPVVRRYRMTDHKLNLEIMMDLGASARAIEVLPGKPETIFVATSEMVAVYDGGTPRRQTVKTGKITALYLRPSDKQLIGFGDKQISYYEISDSGVRVARTVRAFSRGEFVSFGEHLAVNEMGDLFDLDRSAPIGRIALPAQIGSRPSSCIPFVDPTGSILAIVRDERGAQSCRLAKYSPDRFVEMAGIPLGNVMPNAAIAWDDGIAIKMELGNLHFTSQRLLVAQPETPIPAPKQEPDGVIRISIPTKDLVYSRSLKMIAASIPAYAGSYGNSVVLIDPATGKAAAPFFAGSEPIALAFSKDGNRLYAGSEEAPIISQLNAKTGKLESTFSILDPPAADSKPENSQVDWRAAGIVVLPKEPQSIAVLRSGPKKRSVAIYDQKVPRTAVMAFDDNSGTQKAAETTASQSAFFPDWIIPGDAINTLRVIGNFRNANLPVWGNVSTADKLAAIDCTEDMLTFDKSGVRFNRHLSPLVAAPVDLPTDKIIDEFNRLMLDRTGISGGKFLRAENASGAPAIDQSRLFAPDGSVWNADRRVPLGRAYMGGIAVPDSANRRVFYIRGGIVVSFDLAAFKPTSIGYVSFSPDAKNVKGKSAVIRKALLVDGKTIALQTDIEVVLYPLSAMKPWPDAAIAAPDTLNSWLDITKPGPSGTKYQPAPAMAIDEPVPGVRRIGMIANDLSVDADGKLVASIWGIAGGWGNSIGRIDPRTASIENMILTGSEPGKMAFSPDGKMVYVWIASEGKIGRINLRQGKRDLLFSPDFSAASSESSPKIPRSALPPAIKESPIFNPDFGALSSGGSARKPQTSTADAAKESPSIFIKAMAVNPSNGMLAIAYSPHQSGLDTVIALFNEDKPLPNIIRPPFPFKEQSIELFFDKSGQMLYGCGETIVRALVTKDGLTQTSTFPKRLRGGARYEDGLIYAIAENGKIVEAIDPETFRTIGRFSLPSENVQSDGDAILADSKLDRVYELMGRKLVMFDLKSHAALGVLQLPPPLKYKGLTDDDSRPAIMMVKADAETLAIRMKQEVFLVRIAAIPQIAQTAAWPLTVQTPGVRIVEVEALDLAFDRARKLIYAGVPKQNGPQSDTVTAIDPETGKVTRSIFNGTAPSRLLLSEDSRYLYMLAEDKLKRLDLSNNSILIIPPRDVRDFTVMPGAPGSIAVKTCPGSVISVAAFTKCSISIYDDDKLRPQTAEMRMSFDDMIFVKTNILYCFVSTGPPIRLSVTNEGVSMPDAGDTKPGIFLGGGLGQLMDKYLFDDGLLYARSGRVIDPETMAEKGQLSANEPPAEGRGALSGIDLRGRGLRGAGLETSPRLPIGPVALDGERIYWLVRDDFSKIIRLRAFDRQTLAYLSTKEIKSVDDGPPESNRRGVGILTPCGDGRIAFRFGREIYIVDPF
jgi:DNA-binding beta-propeller fold protein YncE